MAEKQRIERNKRSTIAGLQEKTLSMQELVNLFSHPLDSALRGADPHLIRLDYFGNPLGGC